MKVEWMREMRWVRWGKEGRREEKIISAKTIMVSGASTPSTDPFLYKSFAQAWTVILMDLSIDYHGIDLGWTSKTS